MAQLFSVHADAVSAGKKQLIGHLCVCWSILEAHVEFIIWEMLGLDRKSGRKFTAHLDLAPRLDEMKAIAWEVLGTSPAQELVSLAGEIRAAARDRSKIVHALWGRDEKGQLHAISYRHHPTGKAEPYDLKRIGQAIRTTIELTEKLQAFQQSGKSHPPGPYHSPNFLIRLLRMTRKELHEFVSAMQRRLRPPRSWGWRMGD
jgi:hypothetical protein